MNLAFITPTQYLGKFSTQGDIYLALAHLIDDNASNEYARFHRREAEQGKRVILDNGLFEGAQVSTEQLLRRTEAIKASVVCAPDLLYDSKGTIKEFKQFIRAKQDFGLCCKVMGIPQANNPSDWWDCFQFMQSNADCDMVGLSILSVPESFENDAAGLVKQHGRTTGSRMHLIRELYALAVLSGARLKPMHLLGLGDSYEDIKLARYLLARDIVSNDSSSTFVHGMHNVWYRGDGSIPGGKNSEKLDFDLKLSQRMVAGIPPDQRLRAIQYNIDIAKEIAHE